MELLKKYYSLRSDLILQVEQPNIAYNPQKLIKLVRTNIIAKIPSIRARVPDIVFVKYNTPITIASNILNILSTVPTFFFITFSLFSNSTNAIYENNFIILQETKKKIRQY